MSDGGGGGTGVGAGACNLKTIEVTTRNRLLLQKKHAIPRMILSSAKCVELISERFDLRSHSFVFSD